MLGGLAAHRPWPRAHRGPRTRSPTKRRLAERRAAYEEAGRLLEGGPLVPSFETPLLPLLARAAGGQPPPHRPRHGARSATCSRRRRRRWSVSPTPIRPARRSRRAAALLPDAEPLRRARSAASSTAAARCATTPARARRGCAAPSARRASGSTSDLQALVQQHRELLAEETIPMRGGPARARAPGGRARPGAGPRARALGDRQELLLRAARGRRGEQHAAAGRSRSRGRAPAPPRRALRELLRRELPTLDRHADFLAGARPAAGGPRASPSSASGACPIWCARRSAIVDRAAARRRAPPAARPAARAAARARRSGSPGTTARRAARPRAHPRAARAGRSPAPTPAARRWR